MPSDFTFKKTIEFFETDAAGIVHFSNYFRFMEMAEGAFFRSLGLSVFDTNSKPMVGWPRVNVACEYKAPLRFEDELTIHLNVVAKTEKSLTYKFVFEKFDKQHEKMIHVANGQMTIVCVALNEQNEIQGASEVPAEVNDAIDINVAT